jgi:hypothetical protein
MSMNLLDAPSDILYHLLKYVILSDVSPAFGALASTCQSLRNISLYTPLYRSYLTERCSTMTKWIPCDDVEVPLDLFTLFLPFT